MSNYKKKMFKLILSGVMVGTAGTMGMAEDTFSYERSTTYESSNLEYTQNFIDSITADSDADCLLI